MNNGIFMRPAKDGGFIVSSSDIMQSMGGGFGMPEPLFAGELRLCLEYLERTFTPKVEVKSDGLSALNPWFNHAGCKGVPIPKEDFIEIEFRDGTRSKGVAGQYFWGHFDKKGDIVRYRHAIREGEV